MLGQEEEQGWVWRVFRGRCRSALGRQGRGGLPRKTPVLQSSSETGLTRQTGSPRDSLTVEEAHAT